MIDVVNPAPALDPLSPWQRPARLLQTSAVAAVGLGACVAAVRLLPVPELLGFVVLATLMALVPSALLLAAYCAWVQPSQRAFVISAIGTLSFLPLSLLSVEVQPPEPLSAIATVGSWAAALVVLYVLVKSAVHGVGRLIVAVIDWRLVRHGKRPLDEQWERWFKRANIEERISAIVVIVGAGWVIASWIIEAVPADDNAVSKTFRAAVLRVVEDGKSFVISLTAAAALILTIRWAERAQKRNAKQGKKHKPKARHQ